MQPEQWQEQWQNDLNFGSQGDREGLIWQKPNGKWVACLADPSNGGRVHVCRIDFDPWTGERLPEEVEHYEG